MNRPLHFTPAIVSITFVLCLTGFAFVMVAWLPSPFFRDLLPITPTQIGNRALHLGKAAVLVVFLSYAVGVVGWLGTLGLRCDGVHRLSSALEHPACK